MAYMVWVIIGASIAFLVAVSPGRRSYRPQINTAIFAGAFGAVVGGIIGDGVPHALAGDMTPMSLVGAGAGGLLFGWAVRSRSADGEP